MVDALTSLAFFFLVNSFCLNKGFIGTKSVPLLFYAFELLNIMESSPEFFLHIFLHIKIVLQKKVSCAVLERHEG